MNLINSMINKKLSDILKPYGLTLIELIISMTVSLAIIATTYQLFHSQNKSYLNQDQAIETQQNLRAIMSVITREIQSIGYNPIGRSDPGIMTQFPAPHNSFTIDYAQNKDIIAFTADYNGDGSLTPADNEMIAYRLNGNSLERYNSADLQWHELSDNIDALDFVYLNKDRNRTYDITEIRAVEISILAKTNKKDKEYKNISIYKNRQGETLCPTCVNDQYHRRLISLTLQLRNLNL